MKNTLAEVSITLPGGAILKLVRYHEVTQRKSGPARCELVAIRGEKKVRMNVQEELSASSLGQFIELSRRQIERTRAAGNLPGPSAADPESWPQFIANMTAAKMFAAPEILQKAT